MQPASHFIISLDIYPFDVLVSIDQTDEQLFTVLKKYGITDKDDIKLIIDLPDTCRGRCIMFKSNQTVIRLKRQPKKHIMIGVIAHECFHATDFILGKIGMRLETFVSDEAYSYLQQYLVETISLKMKL